MLDFTNSSLENILYILKEKLVLLDSVEFNITNPDLYDDKYSGYKFNKKDKDYIYHSYKTIFELAEQLMCKIQTPKIIDENIIQIKFKKLNINKSFHKDNNNDEKYGIYSEFFNINKNEEISFLIYYLEALKNININKRPRILNIGINKGDEFELIKNNLTKEEFENIEFVGLDYSKSIIDFSKEKFNYPNMKFIQADINEIDKLNLGKFDLIISIGTLQSSSISFKLVFNSLIQNYLNKDAAIIIGFPNARWIDGQLIYGAKMKNYRFSDMSLLINDIHYCKKYLQQKKFKINISGKDYIFLSASKIYSSSY